MRRQDSPLRPLPLAARSALAPTRVAAALLFGLVAVGSARDTSRPVALVAETFGPGTSPMPELGLILELVDGDRYGSRLRLFGGLPTTPAAIRYGPLSGEASIATGVFDHRGCFSVELPESMLGCGEVSAQAMSYDFGMRLLETSRTLLIYPEDVVEQPVPSLADMLLLDFPVNRWDAVSVDLGQLIDCPTRDHSGPQDPRPRTASAACTPSCG